MRMDNQLWRNRGTQLAGVIGLLAILFFVYKLMDQRLVQSQTAVEREINAANATVTAQTNLRITADAQAQAAQETAVAAQHLLATVEAKASDIIATATAQSQIPLTPTTDPHSLEQDQETLAYRLALEAELILNEQPQLLERSILLAIESVQRHANSGAVDILKNGISLLPRYEMALNHRDFGYLLAYSPDGQLVASAGDDNNHVLIWDINNSSEVDRLVFSDSVRSIKFSPGGDFLAITWGDLFGGENTVTLWEKAEGEETMSFNFDDKVLTARFSPDTHYLTTVTETFVTLWDLTTGQELMNKPNSGMDVSFSADGQFIYTIFENSVQRWRIATEMLDETIVIEETITGKTLFSPQGNYLYYDGFPGGPRLLELNTGVVIKLQYFPSGYSEIVFSPDERYLVTTQSEGSLAGDTFGHDLVQLWDVATGRELMRIEDAAFDLEFSPDSRYLVVPMGKVASVWELPSQQEAFRIVQDETISSPVFSPEGNLLVVHSSNWVTSRESTHVWEMVPVQWYWRFEQGSPQGISSTAFSPDGRYVATGGEEDFVYVWDTTTGEMVTRFDHQQYGIKVVTFSPNGRYLLSGGATIPYEAEYTSVTHIWDIVTMSEAISLTHDYQVRDASFSPDSKYLATIGFPYKANVFDMESGEEVFSEEERGYLDVQFSPNGHYLATMDLDTLWLWDTTNWQEVLEINNIYYANFRFSPDDQLIVFEGRDSQRNNTLHVQEISTGREVLTIPYEDGITSLDISPDNNYVAVSSGNYFESTTGLQVWKIVGGEKMIDLPTDSVLGEVKFSHDGRYLAFEYTEGVVSVLDMTTFEEISRLPHPNEIYDTSFSPDNQQLLIQNGPSTVYLWRFLPEDIISEACSRLSRNLTQEEWLTFIGDEPYHPTCPNIQ